MYFVRFTELLKQSINRNLFDYFKAEYKYFYIKFIYLRQLRISFFQALSMYNAACALSHHALQPVNRIMCFTAYFRTLL